MMIQMIGFTERNTCNFFQNLSSSLFSRIVAGSERNKIQTWENVPGEAILRALRSRFQRIKIQTTGLTGRNIWNFVSEFFVHTVFQKQDWKWKKKTVIQAFKNVETQNYVRFYF